MIEPPGPEVAVAGSTRRRDSLDPDGTHPQADTITAPVKHSVSQLSDAAGLAVDHGRSTEYYHVILRVGMRMSAAHRSVGSS